MGFIVLRADLHIHSNVSDGELSPENIVFYAIKKRLHVISITDHNSFRGSIRARNYVKSRQLPIVIIIGSEVRTSKGDVLILCSELPSKYPPLNNVCEIYEYAESNSCIAIPAHPYDVLRSGIATYTTRCKWHAIEAFNASASLLSNIYAYKISLRLNLPKIASSDAHVEELIGWYYTLIDSEPNPEEVLDAIRKGKVRMVIKYLTLKHRAYQVSWSIKKFLRSLFH